jgi:hypothetical protein
MSVPSVACRYYQASGEGALKAQADEKEANSTFNSTLTIIQWPNCTLDKC